MTTWAGLTVEGKTAAVRSLKADGLSARQIAAELQTTRSAIIGYARRHIGGLGPFLNAARGMYGIPKKQQGIVVDLRSLDEGSSGSESVPKIPPPRWTAVVPATVVVEVETPPVQFIDRRMGFECAYILDMADLTCCGRATQFGASWCNRHRSIVFGRD